MTSRKTARPIETEYRGHRFRSRLEARWALFFDALGVPWEYEPEAFAFEGERYLPDFRLRVRGARGAPLWAEVKPPSLEIDADFAKARRFALAGLAHEILLLDGPPDFRGYRLFYRHDGYGNDDFGADAPGWAETDAWFHSRYLPGGSHEQENRLYLASGEHWESPYLPLAHDVFGVEHAIRSVRARRFWGPRA